MKELQSLYIYLPSIVISFILSVYVYWADKKNERNVIFSLITLLSGTWLLILFFSDYTSNDQKVFFWSQAAIIPPAFIPPFLYYFATIFPHKDKNLTTSAKLVLSVPPAIVTLFAFSPYNVKSVTRHDWGVEVEPGVLYSFLTFYYITLIFVSLYVFIKKYRHSVDREQKVQIAYIVIGLFVMIGTNVITSAILVAMGNSQFSAVGTASVLIFLGLTVYAMMEKKLFNVKTLLINIAISIVIIAILINTLAEIISSDSLTKNIIKIIVLLAVAYGGYLILKLTHEEIERRKQIQKLAHELERANNHLKELDAMKDNFMSMASHELNTPTAAIEGYLSMILDEGLGGKIPPEARKWLDSVYKSSKRLAALVKDLLNVSRIESNRIHLIYVEARMEEVVEQAIAEINSKVKEAKHDLIFNKPEKPLPKTWCDVSRITEVVINILGNAIKYTPPGGKINIKAEAKGGEIEVSIKDNGRGIPADKRDRVFQKFSQVDVMKDEVKGTGLGMYISKNLVELHKGKIWFESEGDGKGTTFYFTLPVLDQKPRDTHEGEGAVIQLK